MNALKPITPRSASSSSRSRSPGTRPPQRQKSTSAVPRAASTLRSNERAVDRRRRRVQRHVEEARATTGREGRGAGREPLPVGPARIVEVHVRIDDAGEDVEAGGVDLRRGIALELRADLGDQAVEDPDVGPCNTVRPHHPGSADENIEGAHCRRRGYRQPDGATRTETCSRSRGRARRHRRPRRSRALRLHPGVARRGRRDRRRRDRRDRRIRRRRGDRRDGPLRRARVHRRPHASRVGEAARRRVRAARAAARDDGRRRRPARDRERARHRRRPLAARRVRRSPARRLLHGAVVRAGVAVRVAAPRPRPRRPRGADAPQPRARPGRDDELPRRRRRRCPPSSRSSRSRAPSTSTATRRGSSARGCRRTPHQASARTTSA